MGPGRWSMTCHTKCHVGGAPREGAQASRWGVKGEWGPVGRCLNWGLGWSIIGVFECH